MEFRIKDKATIKRFFSFWNADNIHGITDVREVIITTEETGASVAIIEPRKVLFVSADADWENINHWLKANYVAEFATKE